MLIYVSTILFHPDSAVNGIVSSVTQTSATVHDIIIIKLLKHQIKQIIKKTLLYTDHLPLAKYVRLGSSAQCPSDKEDLEKLRLDVSAPYNITAGRGGGIHCPNLHNL